VSADAPSEGGRPEVLGGVLEPRRGRGEHTAKPRSAGPLRSPAERKKNF